MSKKSSDNKKGSSNRPNFGPLAAIITRFSGNSRRVFLLAALMLLLEAGSATLIPQVIAKAIKSVETFFGQGPDALALGISSILPTLILVIVGMIGLTMINSLCDSLAEIYLAQGGRQVGYNVRVFLYNHLQKLSLSFHTQSRTGDILTKVTSDVAAVENFIIGNLSDFVGSVLILIFFLVAMIGRSWSVWTRTGELGVFLLPLIAILIIPLMALITSYFTGRIKAASKRLRSTEGELASAAQEMLASIRVVRVWSGDYEQSSFRSE
jgi:ABC-type multidrug transport system fused ATPase/permease subunit